MLDLCVKFGFLYHQIVVDGTSGQDKEVELSCVGDVECICRGRGGEETPEFSHQNMGVGKETPYLSHQNIDPRDMVVAGGGGRWQTLQRDNRKWQT